MHQFDFNQFRTELRKIIFNSKGEILIQQSVATAKARVDGRLHGDADFLKLEKVLEDIQKEAISRGYRIAFNVIYPPVKGVSNPVLRAPVVIEKKSEIAAPPATTKETVSEKPVKKTDRVLVHKLSIAQEYQVLHAMKTEFEESKLNYADFAKALTVRFGFQVTQSAIKYRASQLGMSQPSREASDPSGLAKRVAELENEIQIIKTKLGDLLK